MATDNGGTADWCYGTEKVIGQKVRQLRTRRGWSQEHLSRELRGIGFPMHQTTVAKLESGERPLRVAEAVAVAAVFRMPFEALFHMPRQTGEPADIAALREQLQEQDEHISEWYDTLQTMVNTIATAEANRTWLARQIAAAANEESESEDDWAMREMADIRARMARLKALYGEGGE